MQIIKLRNSQDGHSYEYALIELQGDLKSRSGVFEGQYIGDLHFTSGGAPVLTVGHHVVYGKEVIMAKPLALLKKVTYEDSTEIEYIVKSIIKKKIVFKTRPKPIVWT